MSLINPGFGLIIWMTLAFGILLFVLAKFAWKPIMAALKEREDSIENALLAAEKAQQAMEELKLGNEKLMQEAQIERDTILKEARKLKDVILNEAREKSIMETKNMIQSAREQITTDKNAALAEIKNTIASYSISIAEKILREELKDKSRQMAYAEKLLKETSLN
ncbi:MAG: ATP synthase F0 subunit B [Bacteroidetes bacterium GWF2_41_31]|jgi:F-type H+-transporting ATPase subunit b|nr:F0F1 ATP synthase subunit B [Bacteroidota bacterium]OFY48194.1 MAG: ATP synthase F0 subunit B [Bacteroidetes bacterium GWF2_41_31]PKP31837.1 MAG: ATP synthase F0 subunit B [Bacteroidetes bacterium HGW-Bacteroidetes-16]